MARPGPLCVLLTLLLLPTPAPAQNPPNGEERAKIIDAARDLMQQAGLAG